MLRILPKLVHLIAVWTLVVWSEWNSDWLAQQTIEYVPLGPLKLGIGCLIGFSATAWPLALEVAVEKWRTERSLDGRAWIIFMTGGITLLGVGTIALGFVGATLEAKAPNQIYMFGGLICGAVIGALCWLLHLIRKSKLQEEVCRSSEG